MTRRVRIVLSELFYIQSQIFEQNQLNTVRGNSNENVVKQSELFDNEIYLEEITDIICIALAELPSLFNIQEVVETLLYVNNGSSIICWVVANMPDCFKEVVTSLISGDEDTPDGKLRSKALSALCDMSPGQALPTRTLCVELSKMPSLMLRLSLNDPLDLVRPSRYCNFVHTVAHTFHLDRLCVGSVTRKRSNDTIMVCRLRSIESEEKR